MLKRISDYVTEKVKAAEFHRLLVTGSYPRKNVSDDVVRPDIFDYSPEQKERLFQAMRHNFMHHYTHSDYYRKRCIREDFSPEKLVAFEDIWNIPYILSDVFKHYDVTTRSRMGVKARFSSSGTSGKRSWVVYNRLTGRRILFLNYYIYKALGLVDHQTSTNYLMMCVDPNIDSNVGTSNSDMFVSHLAPKRDMFFALGGDGSGGVSFLKDEAVEKLRRYIAQGSPVRILGFMHHTCEVILSYHAKYGRVVFPDNSFILYGGGWKNFAAKYAADFDLKAFLTTYTNIDFAHVRDVYSLNEHGIFYLECEHHHKHVPNLALVCVRDPKTLERLPLGATGLIHLYTPVFDSYPGISILTTDYGSLEESCACGRAGPYLKIHGRAGITKKTTCAMTSEQYIKKG